ncbi:DUF2207 domain-containing protein [Microbacterium lacusdiani]
MSRERGGAPGADPAAPADAVPIPPRHQTRLYRRLSLLLLRIEARSRARGSRGTRLAARIVWTAVAALGVLLLVGPVINQPLGFDDHLDAAGSAADSWIARSFEADYELARDDDSRVQIAVEERITAAFPDDVDESRIERVLVSQYQGHDVQPRLVTAELDGREATVGVRQGATRTVFSIETDERLTGDHELVLRYTLHDVAFDSFDESTREWTQVLEWDAFGPRWEHATAATSVRITVPRELVDDFAREPRAGISWLLLGESTALEVDRETVDAVTYEFTNDQNLPPHAAAWFRFHFAPGSLVMPAPSPVFWVMVVGPFAPLLAAAVVLLLSLAARAVAWGDARGRAWFVAQSEPLDGIAPPLAARLWRAVGTAPLVRALADYQATARRPGIARPRRRGLPLPWRRGRRDAPQPPRRDREPARRALARELHRTGRLGNWPRAWTEYPRDPVWREAFQRNLRRVPDGFVRDNVVGAALALPILQLGLARQLSFQFPLSVFWWPVAVVAATILIAAVVLVIALSARPLTRRGALVREHLLGIRLFAERTSAADRATLADPLLPYAVMFAGPRRGAAIVRRAMDEAGVPRAVREDPDFLGGGRLAIRIASALLVVGAFLLANLVPSPSVTPPRDAAWDDLPGSYGMFVRAFDAEATLERDAAGRPVLEVEERLAVTVSDGSREVPQVLRQWTDRPEGGDQGLEVTAVTIDGEDAPFTTERTQGMALLRTALPDEWPGEHDVVIAYRLAHPVTTSRSGGQWHDDLRWTALNPHWTWGWEGLLDLGGDRVGVERIRVSLTVPADLADRATSAAALDHRRGQDLELREPDTVERDPRAVTYVLTPEPGDDARFLGMRLAFPEGSLAPADRTDWWLWRIWQDTPLALAAALGLAALAAAVTGIRRARGLRPGPLRDVVRWGGPAAALALLPVFGWATSEWSGDEPGFAPIAILGLVAVVATIWSLVATHDPGSDGSSRRRTRA